MVLRNSDSYFRCNSSQMSDVFFVMQVPFINIDSTNTRTSFAELNITEVSFDCNYTIHKPDDGLVFLRNRHH